LQGGWTVSLFLLFAGGEGGSMAKGARGVSPADALSSFSSTAARVKALQRWGSFWSWCPCRLALVLAMVTAEEGDGVGDDWWPPQVQKIYWTSL